MAAGYPIQAFFWLEWGRSNLQLLEKIYAAGGLIFGRLRREASHKSRCNWAFEKKSGDREKASPNQLRVDDSKAKIFLKWLKIMVSVKKGMPLHQAKGRDQAVDGLADRLAARSKQAIVSCRPHGHGLSSCVEHLEPGQIAPHSNEG